MVLPLKRVGPPGMGPGDPCERLAVRFDKKQEAGQLLKQPFSVQEVRCSSFCPLFGLSHLCDSQLHMRQPDETQRYS